MATDMTVEPQTARTPSRTASLVVLVLDVIGLLCLLFVTTFVATRFQVIFADLQIALPMLTTVVLAVPRIVYAVLIGASIVGLVAKERSIADRRLTRNINLIALLAIVICLMVFVVAMFFPLETYITTIDPQTPAR